MLIVVVGLLVALHAAGQRWPHQVGQVTRPVAEFVENLFLGGRSIHTRSSAPPPVRNELVGTARIIDGDTLSIGPQRIRLFAMDAPETDQRCSRSGAVYDCGSEATQALKAIVASSELRCEHKGQSYNRVVAICRADGLDIGREMVRQGHAVAMPQYGRIYVADELLARAQRRGMWAGEFEKPEDFRRRQRSGR